MLLESDTIVALASGCTDSGIGVIRVSGEDALKIVEQIFVPAKNVKISKMKSYRAHFGHIVNPHTKVMMDECIILFMKGPHSYTGEDTVEIDAHGGMFVCNRIIQLLCQMGARMAEPGEFTKRAFLNGRMDLTQAEAVMDVIHADNESALNNSLKQLKGELKEQIYDIRERIIHENAYIEYALDDPEHVSLEGFSEQLEIKINDIIAYIDDLLLHANEGRMLKEGIRTVIVGSPNAGKSSLLNVLLKEERAIVTNVPGTTRDTLEERAMVGNIPLHIVDTAGIRETNDIVESIGVNKAKEVVKSADLVLYVVDCSKEFEEEDSSIIDLLVEKKVIVLLNKSDLEKKISLSNLEKKLTVLRDKPMMLSVSMTTKKGMDEIYEAIKNMFFKGDISLNQNVMINNERQKMYLEKARESLQKVKESITMGLTEDFFTIDLMDAYENLGMIVGESLHDDLVNQIFAEFCTGK